MLFAGRGCDFVWCCLSNCLRCSGLIFAKKNSWQSVCIDSMQKIGAKSHNDALYHTNKDGYLNKDNHFAADQGCNPISIYHDYQLPLPVFTCLHAVDKSSTNSKKVEFLCDT